MKKILVFGTFSLLFAILGIYILKYTSISDIIGILSLIVAIVFAILCICEVISKGNSGLSGNKKSGLVLLLICDVLLATVSTVSIIQRADIFQTIGWLITFCGIATYTIISFVKK